MCVTAVQLLLNWGVLAALIAAVLVIRYRSEEQARAPLPPPRVHLSAAQARQWQVFPAYRRRVPVLLYHGVGSARGPLSIRPKHFAQQMQALKIAGFHTITLRQYTSYVKGNRRRLPSRPVLITFDGGRLDTYRAVNDILRKDGFQAAVFTVAAWPATNPGFSLTWGELRGMQGSGTWSVQEYGASATKPGILRGEHQLATSIPGYHPLALALPATSYGRWGNGRRVPGPVLSWLKRHFQVVFGGDYLDQGRNPFHRTRPRFSQAFSYRITVSSRTSLPVLYCRLRDWVTRTPIWKEYRCLRPGAARGLPLLPRLGRRA